jgi:hypothetical protein
MSVDRYMKAIFGGAAAGLSAAGTAMVDGSVSLGEWIFILTAIVTTAGAVWGVTNAPMPGKASS